jgi:hypothetical protein
MKYYGLIASLCFSSLAFAEDDWNTMENNFKFQSDKHGLEVRTYADDDYDHFEVTNKISPDVTLALRIAEEDTDTEVRPKLTHELIKEGPITLSHRMEYRYFEGEKDDNWRYRLIAKAKAGPAWIKVVPRWEFGHGKTDDRTIDNVKWQAGVDLVLTDAVTLTPFAEYQTDGEDNKWRKKHLIGGTTLKVKF